jgi:hypothetical protein
LHDWNDFTLADGLLVDFAGSPNAAARRFTHYDLQTQTIVQNYYTGGLTPRQAGITWDNTRYWVYDQIAVYNMNGTIGPLTTITGATVLDWTGFCGDATGFRPKSDFGDAPAVYDPVALSPALHEKDTALRLGPTWDQEFNKISSVLADADGSDEDCLATVNVLDSATSNYIASITVYNNTGGNATVIGWLDINGNGTFEASEAVSATVPNGGPVLKNVSLLWANINTPLPSGASTYLRIRIARQSSGMTINNATGYYDNGEVEDYRVMVFGVLPVDLLTFSATPVLNNSVKVEWSTDNETGLDHYEVEQSRDGMNWHVVEKTPVRNGDGIQYYTTWDNAPLKGQSYYRLDLINAEGRTEKYSAIKSVYITREDITVQLTPNPAKERVQLTIDADRTALMDFRFYDFNGRIVHFVKQQVVAGINTLTIQDMVHWPAGIYLMVAHADNEQLLTKKFTVVK